MLRIKIQGNILSLFQIQECYINRGAYNQNRKSTLKQATAELIKVYFELTCFYISFNMA